MKNSNLIVLFAIICAFGSVSAQTIKTNDVYQCWKGSNSSLKQSSDKCLPQYGGNDGDYIPLNDRNFQYLHVMHDGIQFTDSPQQPEDILTNEESEIERARKAYWYELRDFKIEVDQYKQKHSILSAVTGLFSSEKQRVTFTMGLNNEVKLYLSVETSKEETTKFFNNVWMKAQYDQLLINNSFEQLKNMGYDLKASFPVDASSSQLITAQQTEKSINEHDHESCISTVEEKKGVAQTKAQAMKDKQALLPPLQHTLVTSEVVLKPLLENSDSTLNNEVTKKDQSLTSNQQQYENSIKSINEKLEQDQEAIKQQILALEQQMVDNSNNASNKRTQAQITKDNSDLDANNAYDDFVNQHRQDLSTAQNKFDNAVQALSRANNDVVMAEIQSNAASRGVTSQENQCKTYIDAGNQIQRKIDEYSKSETNRDENLEQIRLQRSQIRQVIQAIRNKFIGQRYLQTAKDICKQLEDNLLRGTDAVPEIPNEELLPEQRIEKIALFDALHILDNEDLQQIRKVRLAKKIKNLKKNRKSLKKHKQTVIKMKHRKLRRMRH